MKKIKAASAPIDIVIDPVAWEAHKTRQIQEVNATLEGLMSMGMFADDPTLQNIMQEVTIKSRNELHKKG